MAKMKAAPMTPISKRTVAPIGMPRTVPASQRAAAQKAYTEATTERDSDKS